MCSRWMLDDAAQNASAALARPRERGPPPSPSTCLPTCLPTPRAQALTWPDSDGADLLVDDGGDATLLIHGEGPRWLARLGSLALQRLSAVCAAMLCGVMPGGPGSSITALPLPAEPSPLHTPAAPRRPTPGLLDCLLPCSLASEGVKAEEAYEKDGTLPDPASTDNPEFQVGGRCLVWFW